MVLGDVEGATTQVLERAAILLKDNRLPPRGFSSQHPAYDTVQVGPMAALDADFNRRNGSEGSGADRLVYRVSTGDQSSMVHATARLHYQAVPKRWVDAMFGFSDQSERIAAFESMYEAADRTPVLVAEARSTGWPGFDPDAIDWKMAPNPISSGQLLRLVPAGVEMPRVIELFDLSGRLIRTVDLSDALLGHSVEDFAAGNYLVRLVFESRSQTIRWVKS